MFKRKKNGKYVGKLGPEGLISVSLSVKWKHNIPRLEAMVRINETMVTKVLSIMHGNTVAIINIIYMYICDISMCVHHAEPMDTKAN